MTHSLNTDRAEYLTRVSVAPVSELSLADTSQWRRLPVSLSLCRHHREWHRLSPPLTPYQTWHIHPFNGPFPGLPRWARTRKEKPIWILLKQETVSSSGISWAVCKSAPRSRQITTPAPHHSVFLQAECLSCHPTNSVKALKAYRSDRRRKNYPQQSEKVWPINASATTDTVLLQLTQTLTLNWTQTLILHRNKHTANENEIISTQVISYILNTNSADGPMH